MSSELRKRQHCLWGGMADYVQQPLLPVLLLQFAMDTRVHWYLCLQLERVVLQEGLGEQVVGH